MIAIFGEFYVLCSRQRNNHAWLKAIVRKPIFLGTDATAPIGNRIMLIQDGIRAGQIYFKHGVIHNSSKRKGGLAAVIRIIRLPDNR